MSLCLRVDVLVAAKFRTKLSLIGYACHQRLIAISDQRGEEMAACALDILIASGLGGNRYLVDVGQKG